MRSLFILAIISAAAATVSGQPPASPRTSILELSNGTVVISASSSYGSGWSTLNLADGRTSDGWCSEEGAALPHSIVFELPQAYAISSVAVDNTGAQDSGYPGISSKGITVYGSIASAADGFTELAGFEAPPNGRNEVVLDAPATAQWLMFRVTSNWGCLEYTEIMEIEAYGSPVGALPMVDFAGIYETTYGAMRIEQDGTNVAGCYGGGGELSGNLNGRVMQFEWREHEGKRVGMGIMVLSMMGDALNGVWYEDGVLQGEWSGQRGDVPPDCTVPRSGGIAERLASAGRAVAYGITFDSGSATLKPESETTLNEILAALEGEPSLTLLVAGHTDSTNTEGFNLRLSQQRAETVVAWLVARSIDGSRLTAKGFGESQPVADNATAAGRAINRRVELIAQR